MNLTQEQILNAKNPKLVILGSAHAVPSIGHENTHMALVGDERTVLIDTAANPVVRLAEAGLELNKVSDLVLTHFHPDHVSGVPLLLMSMWLLGREKELHIYGLDYTLERIQRLMDFYSWQNWKGFYPVNFHSVHTGKRFTLLETDSFNIYAEEVKHLVPVIGLRVEFPDSGKVLAYSCDTEPCPAVLSLAENADVLIHEAAGGVPGHTSAAQAGQAAIESGSTALYLIHYNPSQRDDLQALAQAVFDGPVVMAEDFMVLEF